MKSTDHVLGAVLRCACAGLLAAALAGAVGAHRAAAYPMRAGGGARASAVAPRAYGGGGRAYAGRVYGGRVYGGGVYGGGVRYRYVGPSGYHGRYGYSYGYRYPHASFGVGINLGWPSYYYDPYPYYYYPPAYVYDVDPAPDDVQSTPAPDHAESGSGQSSQVAPEPQGGGDQGEVAPNGQGRDLDVTNRPPEGCYYFDPFCGERFSTLDEYTEHLRTHDHDKTILVMERSSGRTRHTLEFVNGYWQVRQ